MSENTLPTQSKTPSLRHTMLTLLPASHTPSHSPHIYRAKIKAAKSRKRKTKAETAATAAAAGIGASPSTPALTPNHGAHPLYPSPVTRLTVFARRNAFLELLPQPRPLADAAWWLSPVKVFSGTSRAPGGRGTISGGGGGDGGCHLFRAECGVLGGEGGDEPLPEVVALVRRQPRDEVFLREQEAAEAAAAAC